MPPDGEIISQTESEEEKLEKIEHFAKPKPLRTRGGGEVIKYQFIHNINAA